MAPYSKGIEDWIKQNPYRSVLIADNVTSDPRGIRVTLLEGTPLGWGSGSTEPVVITKGTAPTIEEAFQKAVKTYYPGKFQLLQKRMKELRDEISELSRDSKRDAEKCQQELTILGNAADKLKAEWHAPPFEVEWVKTHGCMECDLFYLDDCSFAKGSPSCLKKRSEHANGTS